MRDEELYCWQHKPAEPETWQAAASSIRDKLLAFVLIALLATPTICFAWRVPAWANRLGIALEFLSFWFAAPEIVTEIRGDDGKWLRTLEDAVEQPLTILEKVGKQITLILVGLLKWVKAAHRMAMRMTEWLVVGLLCASILLALMFLSLVLGNPLPIFDRFFPADETLDTLRDVLGVFFLVANSLTALVILLVGIVVVIRVMLLVPIQRLLLMLSDDRQIRLRWLKIGVGMFVVGFLFQFIASF
ncbi:MAG: hypothetical protein ACE5JU_10395 [Candidatus Binatia bacterium]